MADTSKLQRGAWSEDEHQRFLAAMQQFPKGPWKTIAETIGSRSVRQVQTHAQQHHEKSARKVLGLRRDRKKALVVHQQQQADAQNQSSSELVSLWRKLKAQGETDGILATSSTRLGRSPREDDLVVQVEEQ